MPPVAEGGLIGIKYQNDFTVIKETMTRVVKYLKPNRGRVIQSDQHQHQCQYFQTFSNIPGLGLLLAYRCRLVNGATHLHFFPLYTKKHNECRVS